MEQVIEKLGIDLKMMLFSTVNFLLVLFILNKYLFGRIGKFLQERKEIIDESLKNADKIKHSLEDAETQREEIIKQASSEANTIVSSAIEKATKESSEIKAKALNEITDQETQSKRKIESERQEMISELKEKTADLALIATEKILDEKLDEKKDREIIDKYLDKLDS